jgi:hypothetical protein
LQYHPQSMIPISYDIGIIDNIPMHHGVYIYIYTLYIIYVILEH